jgi:eukaryotic-like serine/threonine-protein kinase
MTILRETVDRSLMANLPLPLAQAWRRVLYQKNPADLHERALYALEAMVKFTASVAAAAWVARGADGEAVRRACAALVRPSLGHWAAILRACTAALPEDDPVRSHLERLRSAAVEQGVEGLAGKQVGDILEDLPAYRNQVSGHGAGLSATTVAERGPALVALARSALAAMVGQHSPTLMGWAGSQLVQLTGLTAQVDVSPLSPPAGATLFIRIQGRSLPLSPLWIFDVEEDDVLVLNKGAGLTKVEYLSYGSPRSGSGLLVLKGPAAAAAKAFLETATGQSQMGGADVAAMIEETEVSELAHQATDRRFGPYRVVRKLAEGGQGILYEAIQESPPRRVALKTLSLDRSVSEEAQRRMREEAAAIARVEHPNIVPVYESGESDGIPWIAMKFIDGKSLAQIVDALRSHAGTVTVADWRAASTTIIDRRENERRRSYAECAAELARDAARALAACHAHGIVHRDVKPGNLMIDGDGRVMLTDFGLARSIEGRNETFTRKLVGTLQYLAPEALLPAGRKGPDGRVDVYGLGATLYEMLCLRAPFADSGPDEGALLHAVQTKDPLPLRRVVHGLPRDLETIVMKAMEKDRDHRYQTISEFADDIDRYLQGEPIRARPPGVVALAWKWARRNPSKSIGLVAAVLVVAGLSLWQYERQQREHQQQAAQHARQQHVEAVEHDDDDAQKKANAEWSQNKFGEAAEVLAQAAKRLQNAAIPELAGRLTEREQQRQHAQRIAEFYRRSQEAAYRMGEDNDEQTVDACEESLRQLGILTPEGKFVDGPWWLSLPDKDLSASQRRDLQQEVYRQMLMLAFMRLKHGGACLTKFDFKGGSASMRSCVEVLDQARAMEQMLGVKPARVTQIWRKLAASLGGVKSSTASKTADSGAPPANFDDLAENAVDYYLLGAGHFWIWRLREEPMVAMIKPVLRSEMDFATPLVTAERYLRTAVALEPKQYWPHFMLGWALVSKESYLAAEFAFGTCISLQPDNPRGFEWRAIALIKQAAAEPDESFKQRLRQRALADSDQSLRVAANDPSAWWPRADLLKDLGQVAEALDAYARAMELEEDLMEKFSRVHGLTLAKNFAHQQLKERASATKPEDEAIKAQAHVVLALVHLTRKKEFKEASQDAAQALATPGDQPGVVRARAHAVIGTVNLKLNKPAEAMVEFGQALKDDPSNFMAALGMAQAHEKKQEYEPALSAYDHLLSALGEGRQIASTPSRLLEAHLGRYRVLMKLGREPEAQSALDEAKKFNARAAAKATAQR